MVHSDLQTGHKVGLKLLVTKHFHNHHFTSMKVQQATSVACYVY